MSTINEYDLGDAVRCYGEFRNFAGDLADPDDVTVKYRRIGTAAVTKVYGDDIEVVKSSTGIYYIDITPDRASSIWAYKWLGDGAVRAASERRFKVKASDFV